MPFNVKSTLDSILSYLKASGHFLAGAQVGEPKAPPTTGQGLFAAVYMTSAKVGELTLATTIELHLVAVRIYRNMLTEPTANIETDLAIVVADISNDLLGDYDLGATVRGIDAGGQYGTVMGATWGHLDVSGTAFRVVDLELPLIVDDSATFSA